MEYLLVRFDDDRELVVDGRLQGRTNLVVELDRGTHIVMLQAPPDNFTPTEQRVVLMDTTPLAPKEVIFAKLPS